MYLKLVTYNEDLQFLVKAKDISRAKQKAMDACVAYLEYNFYPGLSNGEPNGDEVTIEEIRNTKAYKIENADMEILDELFRRSRDYQGTYGEAIVFEG